MSSETNDYFICIWYEKSMRKINSSIVCLENESITYPFIGNNAKSKIATYQLKKSQLDFRLVIRCNQTGEFLDLNVSCRTNALLEGKIPHFLSILINSLLCRRRYRMSKIIPITIIINFKFNLVEVKYFLYINNSMIIPHCISSVCVCVCVFVSN